MQKNSFTSFLLLSLFFFACTSAPKISQQNVSELEAKKWFSQYCGKGFRKLEGEIVIRATTKEFKGQYPADIRFEANGGFILEVTSIIGGTMLKLKSDGQEMAMSVPPKPQYNREHISHYLGLDLPILSELLMGDLPCPSNWKTGGVRVSGNRMQILTPNWIWNFEKAEDPAHPVPVRITLIPSLKTVPNQTIQLFIEDWNQADPFAKKVVVKSSEGELKWTWRDRHDSTN